MHIDRPTMLKQRYLSAFYIIHTQSNTRDGWNTSQWKIYITGQFVGKFFLWGKILVLLTSKYMDFIGCNWFRNICPNFWKRSECISIRNFGKESPSEYISCSFEWADSLEVKVKSAEGANGIRFTRVPSVETTFWAGFCKVQTMLRNISGEISQTYCWALSWRAPIVWLFDIARIHGRDTRCYLQDLEASAADWIS